MDEAGANGAADEILARDESALLGDLDLEAAAAEAQVHDHVAARGGGIGALAGARLDADGGIVLLDLIPARYAEVDAALADKGRDVGGGQEDEGNGEVLDEGDVEAVLAAELDVGTLEQVQRGLVQPAL